MEQKSSLFRKAVVGAITHWPIHLVFAIAVGIVYPQRQRGGPTATAVEADERKSDVGRNRPPDAGVWYAVDPRVYVEYRTRVQDLREEPAPVPDGVAAREPGRGCRALRGG